MSKKKKIILVLVLGLVAALAAVPCFASSAPSVSTSDIAGILTAVTDQFSVSNIVTFLAYIITATVALVFLWWAVRRAYNAIMSAATSGRAKLGGKRGG